MYMQILIDDRPAFESVFSLGCFLEECGHNFSLSSRRPLMSASTTLDESVAHLAGSLWKEYARTLNRIALHDLMTTRVARILIKAISYFIRYLGSRFTILSLVHCFVPGANTLILNTLVLSTFVTLDSYIFILLISSVKVPHRALHHYFAVHHVVSF